MPRVSVSDPPYSTWTAAVARRLPLPFRILYRQFLLRVIDLEALSIEADIPRFLGQFAGILMLISLAKLVGTLWIPPPPEEWLIIEQGQIANMLLVVGLIAVVSWDATFPDRRDVMVLGPLPVRPRTILLAKMAASAALVGIATLALNFASSAAYALVFGKGWGAPRFFFAWWFTLAAASALLYGSVLTVQGITALLLPRRLFLQVSAVLQLAAYAVVLGGYFLLPSLPSWADAPSPRAIAAWSPLCWLTAVLNQLNGTLPAGAAWMTLRAWVALALAVTGALASLALCYLRTMKRTVEEPDLVPGARGLHWTPRLGTSLHTAIVLFCFRSLTRSRQHRVIFAFYLSIVFAIALSWARSEFANPVPAPLPTEFLMSTIVIMVFAVFGLRAVFSLPVSLNANWILRITQLHPARHYIAAVRLTLLLFGVLPALLLSAALALSFRPWWAVVEHLFALALLGWVFVEVGLLHFQKVPFTCSYLPGKANVQAVFWIFAAGLMLLAFTGADFEVVALYDIRRYAVMLGVLGSAAIVTGIVNRQRARVAPLDFEERTPVEITTLGIARMP